MSEFMGLIYGKYDAKVSLGSERTMYNVSYFIKKSFTVIF